MAEVLNAIAKREVVSPVVAGASGCCAPANVYFYYLSGGVLADIGKITGRSEVADKAKLLLILGIFLPQVAAMILQGHVNEVYDA